jgi:hypothetical protein
MKSDVLRKRSRHDARRGNLSGQTSDSPSVSPGASRRPSADVDDGISPTLFYFNGSAFDVVDIGPQSSVSNGALRYAPATTQSALVGALGVNTAVQAPGSLGEFERRRGAG